MPDNLLSPMPGYHWTIGPYYVELIQLGTFRMDAGAIFGIVPKPLWQRVYPHSDDDNRILLATSTMLVRGNGIVMVIDGGIGDKLNERMRQIFDVNHPPRALPRALEARGIAAEDVTHFIYTHLHFDHAGGATEFSNGKIRPVFPKARYLVESAQLTWANQPSDKDKASFLPENWDSVVDSGQLTQLTGDTALLPGIDLRVSHGHTPGMLMPHIHHEDQGLLWTIDLFPTTAHLPPHYIPAADNHPLASLKEKRLCLEALSQTGHILAPGHDPFTAPGRVLRDDHGKWRLES